MDSFWCALVYFKSDEKEIQSLNGWLSIHMSIVAKQNVKTALGKDKIHSPCLLYDYISVAASENHQNTISHVV